MSRPLRPMSFQPSGRTTSRRGFLGALGLGAAALMSGGSLIGCGRVDQRSTVESAGLPTFQPAQIAAADLVSQVPGAPSGYFTYPPNPERAVPSSPLSGETISVLGFVFGPRPNPREQNTAWQAIEQALGGTVDFTLVPSDEYGAKLTTTVAEGDLPDVLFDDGAIKNKAQFAQTSCQDLTPFLAGDAVLDYPNLAAIPTVFWQQGLIAGRLYELPVPRNIVGGAGIYNQTRFAQAGVSDSAQIKNLDDLTALLKELTNPAANRWALGSTGFGLGTFYPIFAVPNTWRKDGGGLTNYHETDEFAAMVEYLARIHQAGYVAPASEGWTKSQMVSAFNTGQVSLVYDGLPGYYGPTGYAQSLPRALPGNVASPFIPFGRDGGPGAPWADNTVVSTTLLRKGADDRIEAILRMADFLASPFGSQEYLMINFGAPGADYRLDAKGNPVATEQAARNLAVPWRFITAPQQAIYVVDDRETVRKSFDTYQAMVPIAVANPCQRLFSPTDSRKGEAIGQDVADTVISIIGGRSPMRDLGPALDQWRASGGDDIRREYEQALARAT